MGKILKGVGFDLGRASFIDSFIASIETSFEVDQVEWDENGSADVVPSLSNLKIAGSIGVGRGSSTIEVRASEIPDIMDVMDSFDPDRELTVSEIIARTIHYDSETDSVVFKTSLAKHSREARVPKADWVTFRDTLQDLHRKSPDILKRYLDLLEKESKAASETTPAVTPETNATE